MKSSGLIYSTIILLLLAGFFSGRSTIIKMKRSETQVNQAYFNIEKKYFEQQVFLIDLLDEIHEECSGITEPLIKEFLPDLSEPKEMGDFSFDQFRDAREKQKQVDLFVNNLEQFLITNCMNLSPGVHEKIEKLEIGQKSILRDWGDYNSIAIVHNTYIKKFPRNFYSSFFKFQSKPYYKVEN